MGRLDQALVDRGLCDSREKARRAILAGTVRINGQPARKASDAARAGDLITLDAPEKYVSRGGHKLEHALHHFGMTRLDGLTAVDAGASTGGFTDCLLQHGAAHVVAVDVGRGLLAWKLRNDQRVTVVERVNARHLCPSHLPEAHGCVDMAVIDCSFISLTKVLLPVMNLVKPGGRALVLIKPQFEAGKAEVDKGGGVIRDPAVHERVLAEVQAFVAKQSGLTWRGVTESPLPGPAGNIEFLALIEKQGA